MRAAAKIGGVLAVVGLVIGLKFWNKSSADADVKKEAHDAIKALPCYAANGPYLDGLVDKFHSQAFDASYTMGGRRRSSKFDEKLYLRTLLSSMSGQARTDGKPELADELKLASSGIR